MSRITAFRKKQPDGSYKTEVINSERNKRELVDSDPSKIPPPRKCLLFKPDNNDLPKFDFGSGLQAGTKSAFIDENGNGWSLYQIARRGNRTVGSAQYLVKMFEQGKDVDVFKILQPGDKSFKRWSETNETFIEG